MQRKLDKKPESLINRDFECMIYIAYVDSFQVAIFN